MAACVLQTIPSTPTIFRIFIPYRLCILSPKLINQIASSNEMEPIVGSMCQPKDIGSYYTVDNTSAMFIYGTNDGNFITSIPYTDTMKNHLHQKISHHIWRNWNGDMPVGNAVSFRLYPFTYGFDYATYVPITHNRQKYQCVSKRDIYQGTLAAFKCTPECANIIHAELPCTLDPVNSFQEIQSAFSQFQY